MRLTLLVAALGAVAAAAPAEEPGFLFDALRLPHYHAAWDRLVKTVEPTPDWLHNFSSYDGEAGAMAPVAIEGKPYKLSYVCEPGKCAAHKFEVLFDADGIHAYGALGGQDEPPAFFGAPNAAQQDALAKALSPAAAPKAEETKPYQPKSE